jgi:hypothetical protein
MKDKERKRKMPIYRGGVATIDAEVIGSSRAVVVNSSDHLLVSLGKKIYHKFVTPHPIGTVLRMNIRCSGKSNRQFVINAIPINPVTGAAPSSPSTFTSAPTLSLGEDDINADTKELLKQATANILKNVIEQRVDQLKNIASKVKKSALESFFMSVEIRESLTIAANLLKSNPQKPVKIMVTGPSGFGKTTLGYILADKLGMSVYRHNCASIRDPEEWFGMRAAKDGSTLFEPSEFIQRVQAGNCVIILDEFNRLETWLTNTLYPLLDDDAKTVVNGTEFKVGENVIFIAAINLGFNYTGTFSIDAAAMNRFQIFCEVGAPSCNDEIKILVDRVGIDISSATQIVTLAEKIRNLSIVECSVRTNIMIAEMITLGLSIRSAYQQCIVFRCNNQQHRREIIDLVNSALGTYSPKKSELLF